MIILKQITSVFLSFLIFTGSSGFTIHKHFCMNDLKKVSLFVTPESCHNKQSTDNYCPAHKKTHHKENEQEKNNCCDNNVDYLKALDSNIDFVSFNNYSFEQKLIAIISILLFEVNFLDIDYKYSSFFEYVSPPLIQDFPVFYQSFLI